ncbi:hypothetical protein TaPaz_44 [Acinetobacter phage TaPaz]|nr:hypothetical protein TaPaz_44 [Acinetobacter phage TaPaz]
MSEINLVNANNLKSTNESKIEVLKKLSKKEQRLFIKFVNSVEYGQGFRTNFMIPREVLKK